MTNPIRPSAITQILRNIGYPVSKSYKGRIKGLTEHTAGVKSERGADGTVVVRYRDASIMRSTVHDRYAKLEPIQQVLQDRGYVATIFTEPNPHIVVERP